MQLTTINLYDAKTHEFIAEIEAVVGGTPSRITWEGRRYRVVEIGWNLDAVTPAIDDYRATIELYLDIDSSVQA